ncbi:MAG: hypothetical protein K0B11_20045 [Mariniphaga sp.]|nr:hypothetical protein [Mariniphaga sp.]
MNKTILPLLFPMLVLTACQNNQKVKTKPQPPNILLINIDDMGWRDVEFMGSEYYETVKRTTLPNRIRQSAMNC